MAELHRLMSGLTQGLDLAQTLTAIVESVVAGLGFGVGVVSMVQADGEVVAAAVAGDAEACAALHGSRAPRAEWDRLLAVGRPVGPSGRLRLIDHRLDGVWDDEPVPTWVPEPVALGGAPEAGRAAWHPLDALFAPLLSPSAGLLGILSVDLPADGLQPGEEQLSLLEMFAVQAAIAVEHARLHTEVLSAHELARTALAVRLQAVVDASPAALIELDRDGTVREWNRAAERLLGYQRSLVLGRALPPVLLDLDLDVPRLLSRLRGDEPFPTVQLRCRRRDGQEVEVELSAAPTLSPAGTVQGFMGLLVDITDRKKLQRQLEHQATHDRLTGLPNRSLLDERLRATLATARECTGVLLIDLDRFKDVNDTLGHHHGDLLLTAVGRRLAGILRPGDTLSRLSGDEFAILLPELAGRDAAVAVAHRALAALHQPFDLDGEVVDLEASIGVCLAPLDGTDPEQLMRQADSAMYQAKELSAGVAVYSASRDGRVPGRLALLGDLRRALDGDELVMVYQPQVDMSTGRPCGLEALVRWQHPERGLLTPADFLPVAETTGLITRLTLRVLDLVLAQTRQWAEHGRAVPVAVNVSARCLHDAHLPDLVRAALDRHGVPPELLRLEVTESAIMSDPDRALAILQQVADSGVRLSLDDFGTGYSSMSYLRRLPVDELKVDRSFVSGMLDQHNDRVLVHTAVDLGHNLGMSVVAEGVEDSDVMQALADLGCDVAQGYHLGRPMTTDALETWWAQAEAGPAAPSR